MKFIIATAWSLATGVLGATTAGTGSICPFNYPAEVNTTESGNGLIFTIASNNPVTNNRALQLRTNPNSEGLYYVGLDASSPVLLSNFADGAIKSQARNQVNAIEDLGPTGYLNKRTVLNGTTEYIFGFANATTWPGEVDTDWYLSGGPLTGTYNLYHNEGLGVVNGFVLCEADFDTEPGPWYALFYYVYKSVPADLPGCEFVAVRTTVAPFIENGECEIAGHTA
ncbi:hypothetical protein F5Y18DRAFT_104607 [Xylariaceae sp. FL1019]|nr:hypothetical protein F5Y18DRAFT_104607 [Xylariaceae sp. FL1019]